MLNGDGLRVVLWVSGCSHKCNGCQNPETWDKFSGVEFDSKALTEIVKELKKDYVSGITYSGGDPLFHSNRKDISDLASYFKLVFPDKTQWLYTGFTWEKLLEMTDKYLDKILKNIDVLVDGKFDKNTVDRNPNWRGSINQRIIDVKKSLKSKKVILYYD